MKCFVAVAKEGDNTDGEVFVLTEFFNLDREEVRKGLREQFGTTWVWWEDEIGTLHDPLHGPIVRIGPRAKKENQ